MKGQNQARVFVCLLCLVAAAASAYPAEGENYLCKNVSTRWPLPCKAPWEGWKWKMKGVFPISAWWTPLGSVQYAAFAKAHFNLLSIGGIQGQAVTPQQHWDYIVTEYKEATALGLFTTIHSPLMAIAVDSPQRAWGGREGGRSDGNLGYQAMWGNGVPGHYASVEEIAWLTEQVHNMSMDKAALMFVRDDTVDLRGWTEEAMLWLKANTPDLVSYVNQATGCPEWLARTGTPLSCPELYMVSCGTSGTACNATSSAINQVATFEQHTLGAQRFNLSMWPLFNVGDGGGTGVIRSDSLTRFQAYSAVAFGSKGLLWYCWGNGIWNLTSNSGTIIYPVVAECNARVQSWAQYLLEAHFVSAVHTSWGTPQPSASSIVTDMSTHLLVGLLQSESSSTTAYAVVVDKRVNTSFGVLPARNVTVTFNNAVTAVHVAGADQSPELQRAVHIRARPDGAQQVTLTLAAGDSQLLVLSGGNSFGQLVDVLRPWQYSAVSASVATVRTESYPWYGIEYNPQSTDFVLGADAFPSLNGNVDENMMALTRAYFNSVLVNVPSSGGGNPELPAGLNEVFDAAYKYGTFVMLTSLKTQASACNTSAEAVLSAETLSFLHSSYSCHPNLGGFMLGASIGNASAGVLQVAATAANMRRVAGMMLPYTTVCSASAAGAVADSNVPAVSPVVPLPETFSQPAIQRAQGVLQQFQALRSMGSQASVWPSLDVCHSSSDSVLRFNAYAALAYGARGLWTRGVGECVPSSSPVMGLLGGINRRVTHWGNTLLAATLQVTTIFSTGWEAAGTVAPSKGSLVQAMSDDLLVSVLDSSPSAPMLMVVDKRVNNTPGSQPIRDVSITLRDDVIGVAALEGNCDAGFCSCTGRIRTGNVVTLKIPGGSGQLVGLEMVHLPSGQGSPSAFRPPHAFGHAPQCRLGSSRQHTHQHRSGQSTEPKPRTVDPMGQMRP